MRVAVHSWNRNWIVTLTLVRVTRRREQEKGAELEPAEQEPEKGAELEQEKGAELEAEKGAELFGTQTDTQMGSIVPHRAPDKGRQAEAIYF